MSIIASTTADVLRLSTSFLSRRRYQQPLHLRSRLPLRQQRRDQTHLRTAARPVDDDGPQLERLNLESSGGLGGTSEDVFGPLAVLSVGFKKQEFQDVCRMLDDIDATMIERIPCPSDGLDSTLGELIVMTDVPHCDPPLGLRRILFLSGMYASEVQEVVAAYRDAGLPETVFAAYVPKNKNKRITDLIEEIYGDHEYMIAKRNRERGNKDTK